MGRAARRTRSGWAALLALLLGAGLAAAVLLHHTLPGEPPGAPSRAAAAPAPPRAPADHAAGVRAAAARHQIPHGPAAHGAAAHRADPGPPAADPGPHDGCPGPHCAAPDVRAFSAPPAPGPLTVLLPPPARLPAAPDAPRAHAPPPDLAVLSVLRL